MEKFNLDESIKEIQKIIKKSKKKVISIVPIIEDGNTTEFIIFFEEKK